MKRAGQRKFGKVTWDGRLVVDVDQLYRSKQVQRVMQRLDGKIEGEKARVPNSTMRLIEKRLREAVEILNRSSVHAVNGNRTMADLLVDDAAYKLCCLLDWMATAPLPAEVDSATPSAAVAGEAEPLVESEHSPQEESPGV